MARFLLAALILAGCYPLPCAAETWTLAAIGDTQVLVQSAEGGRVFAQMTQWVADNRQTENIVFVTQLGDIVQNGAQDNRAEWARADAAMAVLDTSSVDWATSVGNHDLDRVNDQESGYAVWKSVFGPHTANRFAEQASFVAASDNGLNMVHRYTAGKREYLHLHLELDVPDTAIEWAQSAIDRNPGLPTIISTHVFEGTRHGPPDGPHLSGPGRNSADEVWEKLIKDNDQIFMILSGHTGQRQHRVRTNSAGHPVFTIVQDFTLLEADGANRGWMRLYRFDETNSRIRVRTYSPALDRYMTDAANQFELPLDWETRFSDLEQKIR